MRGLMVWSWLARFGQTCAADVGTLQEQQVESAFLGVEYLARIYTRGDRCGDRYPRRHRRG